MGPAFATSGPGCLRVVNIPKGDVLNVRAKPSASSGIVDKLIPDRHGIVVLNKKCEPADVPWRSRWCSVTHYDDGKTIKGWVKARFVRDSECP